MLQRSSDPAQNVQQVGVAPKFVTFTSEHVSWYHRDDACIRHGLSAGQPDCSGSRSCTLRLLRAADVRWTIESLTCLRPLNASVEV